MPSTDSTAASGSSASGSHNAAELSNWILVRRLLALSWEYRVGCFKVLSLQALLIATSVGSLGLTGLAIDFVAHHLDSSRPMPRWPFGITPPPEWTPMSVVTMVAVAVLILAISRAFLDFNYQIALAWLVQGQLVVDMRARVYDKLQRLSFRFFDSHASGSIINRVTGDIQNLRMFVDLVLIQILILMMQLSISLAYMLRVHVPLTLACLVTTPLLWVGGVWFSRTVQPGYARNRQLQDALTNKLSESVQGVHVIKGFARQDDQIRRFAEGNALVRDQQRWIFLRLCAFVSSLGFLSQANLIVLLAFGGTLVVQGTLPLGAGLIVFAGLLNQFSSQVFKVADIANSVQQSLTAARRVFEVLDTPIEITSALSAKILPPGGVRGEVRFENVDFDFHSGSGGVLRDVSFRIEPGCCLAILGPTGAGKSALLSLIPRFYDPQRGCVRIDGQDLREFDLDSLRRNIGLVFQESFLFSNTVAANIAFGQPTATRAQIERAARLASAHDFISALPQGYQTVLGESASDLSGGQRQRLAIARALLLEPPILLLDDPTAAIDPGTEHEILTALDGAMAGRTTFLVAHRASTLRRADLILVMDKGRVVEFGPPSELMNRAGSQYRRVADLQVADEHSRRLLANAS